MYIQAFIICQRFLYYLRREKSSEYEVQLLRITGNNYNWTIYFESYPMTRTYGEGINFTLYFLHNRHLMSIKTYWMQLH